MTTNLPATTETRAPMATGGRIQAVVPQTMEDAYRLGKAIAASGMAPRGMETPEKCMVAIMHGLEIGLPPMTALQRIAVVNGRPTLWGDGAMSLVRGSGLCEYVEEGITGSGDDRVATCTTKRKGERSPTVRTFSVKDAKTAGLWGKSGPWQQFPERMLQMRARAFALRDLYADVLGGMYLREEIEEDKRSDAPPAPPPPPSVRRDAGTVEDAVIVEPTKPADPKPVDPVEDAVGEDEVEFDFDPWIETVRDAFATCQSESDVDEAHAEFEETVENILGSEQRMTSQEIHEEALTRVTSPAEEEAPAAPPPPAATKKTADDVLTDMRTGKLGAPAMDDEEEEQPLAPGAAYLARGDAALVDPNRTKESINAFWNDTKAERIALKKAGQITNEELQAYVDRSSAEWDALDRAELSAGDEQDPPSEGGAGGSDMSDQDKRIAAFTAEFEKRMNEIETMTELNSYFSSTLKTRNEFGLEMTDPRKKAWQQLKVDRTAAINSAS